MSQSNNNVDDAVNAADEVIAQFEAMVNDYEQTTQQLNQVISQNNNNSNNTMDEEYPPPQPRPQSNLDEKQEEEQDNADDDVGGFAAAKHYCSHISSLVIPKDMKKFPKLNEFPECDAPNCEKKENWVCLKCHNVFCGRYANKHMVEHYESNSKHCIAMGVGDLSFWCYKCSDYLHHLSIKKVFEMYKIVHGIKFGIPIPKSLEKETDFMDDNYYESDDADDADDADDDQQKIIGRNPQNNPLTQSGANRGLGNVESGKDTVLEEDQREYFDSDEVLLKKAKRLACMILKSRYTVIHTGAGISTAANLPDYRGPNGVWTLKAKGKSINSKALSNMDDIAPTYCHMALVSLMENKLLNFVVTTNVDGLHIKSGINHKCLAELHGSIYMEFCNKCGKEYTRNYNVQKMQHNVASIATVFTRFTGRFCDLCKGKLRDSIIAFGENLPGNELQNSRDCSNKADLNIVIGSSMRVNPACSLPTMGNQFVLINLQKTPYDNESKLRVWAKCDEFMKIVMDELKINVKPYQSLQSNDNNDKKEMKDNEQ